MTCCCLTRGCNGPRPRYARNRMSLVRPLLVTVGLTFALVNCTRAPASPGVLRVDPCRILTAREVTQATDLAVHSPHLVTEDMGLATCYYETTSRFSSVGVRVPFAEDRSAAHYWSQRDHYFATFPGSAVEIDDIGEDAWLSGGTTLHVLLRGDDYFVVSTRNYSADAGEVLRRLALSIVERFSPLQADDEEVPA
jgi:hypothetical protein